VKADPPNQMSAVGHSANTELEKAGGRSHRSYIDSAVLLLHKVTSRRICSCNIPI
jgi:hypothetical protein